MPATQRPTVVSVIAARGMVPMSVKSLAMNRSAVAGLIGCRSGRDVGGEPFGEGDVAVACVDDVDDAQRLVGAVVFDVATECFWPRRVGEGQGALSALVALASTR